MTTTVMNNRSPIPAMSADTRLLIDHLRSLGVGAVASYADLTKTIGKDVRSRRHSLRSAMRHLLREGKVYAAVMRAGIKRLNDQEIVAVGDEGLRRMRKMANRISRKLSCVTDFDALPDKQRYRHNALMSLSMAVGSITDSRKVEKLEHRVAQVGRSLPLSSTLHSFLE